MASRASNLPPKVREVIWHHMEATSTRHPVSVRDTMRAVRHLVPSYRVPDSALASIIGALATAAGRNVHFDGQQEPPERRKVLPN
jgi:hypothetical protein